MSLFISGALNLCRVGGTFAPSRFDCSQIVFCNVGDQTGAQALSRVVFSPAFEVGESAFDEPFNGLRCG